MKIDTSGHAGSSGGRPETPKAQLPTPQRPFSWKSGIGSWELTRVLFEIAARASAGRLPAGKNRSCDGFHPEPIRDLGEQEWTACAHSPGISRHDVEVGANQPCEVGLVDDEKVGLRDARATFARNLVTAGHVDRAQVPQIQPLAWRWPSSNSRHDMRARSGFDRRPARSSAISISMTRQAQSLLRGRPRPNQGQARCFHRSRRSSEDRPANRSHSFQTPIAHVRSATHRTDRHWPAMPAGTRIVLAFQWVSGYLTGLASTAATVRL
jgi:hypothetical protein